MFDLDDFYSLTSYASRFLKDPDAFITLYFSQKSTAAAVAACEMKSGDGSSVRQDMLPVLFERAERDEMTTAREFIALTGCGCVSVDDGEVSADIAIYNDFVAYLTATGING